MGTSCYFIISTILGVYVAFATSKVPAINPNSLPQPGKVVRKVSDETPVTFYQFTYRGRGYSILTEYNDGTHHNANGTLMNLDDGYMYIEEGEYSETLEDGQSFIVEYRIDKDGYHELNRTEVVISVPYISMKAIGSILG